jgi:hypothetical protein
MKRNEKTKGKDHSPVIPERICGFGSGTSTVTNTTSTTATTPTAAQQTTCAATVT